MESGTDPSLVRLVRSGVARAQSYVLPDPRTRENIWWSISAGRVSRKAVDWEGVEVVFMTRYGGRELENGSMGLGLQI